MNFLYRESKYKKKFFSGGAEVGGLGLGVGVDGRTYKQAQTNLPLQLLRNWGHTNA